MVCDDEFSVSGVVGIVRQIEGELWGAGTCAVGDNISRRIDRLTVAVSDEHVRRAYQLSRAEPDQTIVVAMLARECARRGLIID